MHNKPLKKILHDTIHPLRTGPKLLDDIGQSGILIDRSGAKQNGQL